jgi:hypothetical protein
MPDKYIEIVTHLKMKEYFDKHVIPDVKGYVGGALPEW